ncbi:MAG: hypothetical protein HKO95_02040 [Rhodobacteraceae bacterium]|nr:hypothetical protein [Alphaproteobacteria bacterium]MBT8476334.1 hypothetical protein [Alphaproteobacteria bacterium]NNK65499.1 hypothetical protein [Paracoccaceae bacterium]
MRWFALLTFLFATPLAALELTLRDFYELDRPASLEFDPDFCGLWIANESREAVLYTLDGLELRRVSSDLPRIKAIALEGSSLLVADGFGRFQRLTRDGETLGEPFRLGRALDTEGIALAADGTILSVEDEPGHLLWQGADGTVKRRIDGYAVDPIMHEPQGIEIDHRNGHILVTDDWEGTNSLFEFSPEGELLGIAPLLAYGRDPEGIALRPSTNTLFIAFDGGARIAAFDYVPTGGIDADAAVPGADCVMF